MRLTQTAQSLQYRAHKDTHSLYNQAYIIHSVLMIGLPKITITILIKSLAKMTTHVLIGSANDLSPAHYIFGLTKIPFKGGGAF